jgi:hypothetical protein
MTRCVLCAAWRDPASLAALAWACEPGRDGADRWLCPECARRHVREIEAKLAPEWWAHDT